MLEATAAPAGCELGLAQLDDPAEDIVRAAIAALRPHVHGAGGAGVVDRLTAIAMDSTRGVAAREAALRVLLDLDQRSLRPLLKALRDDPSPEIAALAAKRPAGQPPPEEPGSCSPEPWKDGSLRTRRWCGGLWRKLATRCR